MEQPGTSSQPCRAENGGEEPHETGVYWTPELNLEFIRLRKHFGVTLGKGKRRGMSLEAWQRVVDAMGLQGRLTPLQAKKRWENFVAKYKAEKYPARAGKPADTPVKWPLYQAMDWALDEQQPRCEADNENVALARDPTPPPPEPEPPRLGRHQLFSQFQRGLRSFMAQRSGRREEQPEREPVFHSTVDSLLGNSIHVLTQSVQNRGLPFPEVYDVRLKPGRRLSQDVAGECENNANTIQESLAELNQLMSSRLEEAEARRSLGRRTTLCLKQLLGSTSRQAAALVRLTDLLEDIP